MELKELTARTLKLFYISSVSDLGKALMEHLNDTDSMSEFKAMVDDDLTKDWLQMVYQYYMADREKKKQDFTPVCLGKLMSKLVGSADTIKAELSVQAYVPHQLTCEVYNRKTG